MGNPDYRPRLSIELEPDVKARLDKQLGGVHGLQKAVITIMIEDLLSVLEGENRAPFLTAMLNRQIGITDLTLTQAQHGKP